MLCSEEIFGMQVIAENIKNGGDLNAMVPGQKVGRQITKSNLYHVICKALTFSVCMPEC